jgi:acyl-coenzyme A thioesterase PaaI-like protein
MSLAALAVLADVSMAASMRMDVGASMRMATVAMAIQFTGARLSGPLSAQARVDSYLHGAASRTGLTRAEIRGAGELVGTASGSFIAIPGQATAPLPMEKREAHRGIVPLTVGDLNESELSVWARAQFALGQPDRSFIEHFWGLLPERGGNGASCDFTNGVQVGNRVGHTQGGITFALAAVTAAATLGDEWLLSNASAWYIRPGVGPTLRAESIFLHQGRLTSVVRSTVADSSGRLVLEMVSTHSKKSTG